MAFHDIPVEAIPQGEMEAIAAAWRNTAAGPSEPRVDVFSVLQTAKVQLVPRSDKEMADELAYACPTSRRIFHRNSLIVSARSGDVEATLTLAHEFGHVVLHRGSELKARKVTGNAQLRFIRPEESAEDQAWRFARALLVPPDIARQAPSGQELASLCAIPVFHAELRIRETCFVPPKNIALVEELIASTRQPSSRDEEELEALKRRLQVWNKAATITAENPAEWRKCGAGRFRVRWTEFNQMTECGWTIRDGRIVAWMSIDK